MVKFNIFLESMPNSNLALGPKITFWIHNIALNILAEVAFFL
jgi:hypothetical protein